MQLAQLIPHLDAEIARLQRARDLLAFVPTSCDFFTANDNKQAARAREHAFASRLVLPTLAASVESEPEAGSVILNEPQSQSTEAPPGIKAASVPTFVKERRISAPGDDARPGRRKRLIVLDTALRGPVPSGPVVVSAEEVRKSQASKSAQATRAAEVRRAGSEIVSSFGWRSRSNQASSVDALLQRLINIGAEGAHPEEAHQLPALGDGRDSVRSPHASKMH